MTRRKTMSPAKYTVIVAIFLLIVVPFWDMIINSFKTSSEAAIPSVKLPSKWQIIENYTKVIIKGKLIDSFKNSLLITSCSTLIILTTSTMAAFVFAQRYIVQGLTAGAIK